MAEEIIEQIEQQETLSPLEELAKVKETMVTKEEYSKVLKERNDYFNALANGKGLNQQEQPKQSVDVDALRKELATKELTNLDYWQKTLELREALIEKDGIDIFVAGGGKDYVPSDDDYLKAQKVADGMQEIVTIADGNPDVFRREFERLVVDSSPSVSINTKIRR